MLTLRNEVFLYQLDSYFIKRYYLWCKTKIFLLIAACYELSVCDLILLFLFRNIIFHLYIFQIHIISILKKIFRTQGKIVETTICFVGFGAFFVFYCAKCICEHLNTLIIQIFIKRPTGRLFTQHKEQQQKLTSCEPLMSSHKLYPCGYNTENIYVMKCSQVAECSYDKLLEKTMTQMIPHRHKIYTERNFQN